MESNHPGYSSHSIFSRAAWLLCGILFVCLATGLSSARAEVLNICGLSFKVDSVSPVDSQSVKVIMGGESRVILRDKLEEFAVAESFSSSAWRSGLSLTSLRDFLKCSLQKGAEANALAALDLMARGSFEGGAEAADFLLALSSENEFRAPLSTVLKKASVVWSANPVAQSSMATALLIVGLQDVNWLRSNATQNLYPVAGEFKSLAVRYYTELAAAKNHAELGRIVDLLDALFGSEDESLRRLHLVHNRLMDLRNSARNVDSDRFFVLVEGVKNDSWQRSILYPLVLDLVHDEATWLLSINEVLKALRALALLDFETRTPTTHQLVLQAVKAMGSSEDIVINDARVVSFLEAVCQNDQAVRDAYSALLEGRIRRRLGAGDVTGAESFAAALYAVRPAEPLANDAIRFELAVHYAGRGLGAQAAQSISQAGTSIPLSVRFELLRAGYYLDFSLLPYMFLVIILCTLLLAVHFGFIKVGSTRRRSAEASQGEQPQDSAEETSGAEVEDNVKPAFVFSSYSRGLNPRRQEYENHLKAFGLNPDAGMSEIKSAYRSAVKEYHPDLHHTDPHVSDKFIELTRKYDRLQQLRKELNIKD